jgi:hypothetical protein
MAHHAGRRQSTDPKQAAVAPNDSNALQPTSSQLFTYGNPGWYWQLPLYLSCRKNEFMLRSRTMNEITLGNLITNSRQTNTIVANASERRDELGN